MNALQKKREVVKIYEAKLLEQKKKELSQFNKKKEKHDENVAKNIPDEKLTITQLKSLLAFKKRKENKRFSIKPKTELLALWKEWKHRITQAPFGDEDIIESVAGATNIHETTVTISDTCPVQEDEPIIHAEV